MNQTTQPIQFADIFFNGRAIKIEYQWIGPAQSADPVIVFLHEGLGSISMWRGFPEQFCNEHGFTGLVFSRYGYGKSTPRIADERVPVSYLHAQAHDALPALLSALNIERPWLFGHSDGGSIALLYAARFPQQVSGLVVMAPHIFVEDITIEGIRKARTAFQTTDLRDRLARHHTDVDSVFRGWNDTWLDPAFRAWNIEDQLGAITCPVLAMQGEGDEYGTLAQIHGIEQQARNAQALALPDCGHSPHRDQPAQIGAAAARFIRQPRPQ